MKSALEAWELKADNQVCLTTDNGSNIVKAANDLEWLRLSCFGNNLHLAVTKALNGDQRCVRVLGICRRLQVLSVKVGKGSKSSQRHSLT